MGDVMRMMTGLSFAGAAKVLARGAARAAMLALGTAGAAILAHGPAGAAEQAGVAAAVVAPVSIDGAPRPAPEAMTAGDQVFTDDRIRTGEGARAQIMFLDQTALTIGSNSDIVIDRFVYDPARGTGEIAAEMATGFLRYLSGSVGAGAPENVTIATPAATIGIRGSAIIVASLPGDPNTWFCGVLGPGLVNNALARRGACLLENEEGETEIRAAGFGAFVTKGRAPSAPVLIPEEMLSRLHRELRPTLRTAAAPLGGVGSSGEASGQETAQSGQQAAQNNQVVTQRFDQLTVNFASNIINPLPPLPDDPVVIDPDPILNLPVIAQTVTNGEVSTALTITGEIPFTGTRYRVNPEDPLGPRGFDGRRLAVLEPGPENTFGQVAEINSLGFTDITRISVFNVSDPSFGGTSLAQNADLLVALLRNGVIRRGPGGSVEIDGDLIDQISPARGGQGNTFVAYEIAPDGVITRLGTFADFESLGDVE